MFVYYHYPCNDGEMAKTLWQQKYPDAKYIKYKHQNEYKELYNYKNETIVFLDISPPTKFILDCNKYIVIDHHKNPVETLLKENKNNVKLIHDFNKSGCMLVWDYLYGNKIMPLAVYHIGKKDIWDFSHKDTEPLCSYIETHYDIKKDCNFIELLDDVNVKDMIVLGQHIVNEDKKYAENIMKNLFIDIEENYMVLNVVFDGNKKYYKYMIEYAQLYYIDCDVLRIHNHPTYSLRRLKDFSNGNPVNVDVIARKYGGNGHPGAAGYKL